MYRASARIRGRETGRKQQGFRQVSASSTKSSGVAARYARALFELAAESGETDAVAADLEKLGEAVAASADLARLIESPLFSAEEQIAGLDAVMEKLGIGGLAANFVRLVAQNRRLPHLTAMIEAYRALVAERRGEIRVHVTSAAKLTAAQAKKVTAALKEALGSEVLIENEVDPSIMGGLVVKAGSRMIDTSVKTRLNTLKSMLKGM